MSCITHCIVEISKRKADGSCYKKTEPLLDGHLKAPPNNKNFFFNFTFLNNHQCNYTKTISHLRRREYGQKVTSTSSWWLFADIHVA